MSAAMQRITAAEYLAFDRDAKTKHEFVDGKIVAMAGASEEHNIIVGNVIAALHPRVLRHGCRTYPGDMRVRVTKTGSFVYPDVVIVCGPPQIEEDNHDVLLNPTLIIEVLSPSTEAYDRGDKAAHYRCLESLQAYVLVAQDRARVERYVRQEHDQWLLTDFDDLKDCVSLLAGNCELSLAEIYNLVEFPTPATARLDEQVVP